MAIQLQKQSGQIDLSKKMYKGDDGGYYTPTVDENGTLSWIPSEEDMATIPSVNIKGEQGETGEAGIYVGAEEPTDDSLVWINPDGEASTGFATKEYVDEAVANAATGGVDLSAYALKTEIPDVSDFQTQEQVQGLIDASLPPSAEEVAY